QNHALVPAAERRNPVAVHFPGTSASGGGPGQNHPLPVLVRQRESDAWARLSTVSVPPFPQDGKTLRPRRAGGAVALQTGGLPPQRCWNLTSTHDDNANTLANIDATLAELSTVRRTPNGMITWNLSRIFNHVHGTPGRFYAGPYTPSAEVELLQAKLRIAELEKEKLELELRVAKRDAVSDDDDEVDILFTGNLEKTNTTVDEGNPTVSDALPEPLAFVLPDGPLNTVLSEELQERLHSLETLQASIPSSSAMSEDNNLLADNTMPGDLFGRGAAHLCTAVLLQTANVSDLVDNYQRQAIKSLGVKQMVVPKVLASA
ncbi:MAG: hypothetical protein BJ554DRAFT_1760, partial [Olpidium bornovanus]